MRIADREIGHGPPYVVAEIGQNHNGDVYHALRLVGAAVQAGADAVKFQYRDCELEFPREVLDKPHPHPSRAYGDTYREHRQALDLSLDDLCHIQHRIAYNRWPVSMIVTPCHFKLVNPLHEAMDLPAYKVASKDADNWLLLDALNAIGRPVIVSTGKLLADQLPLVLGRLDLCQVAVLHCVSRYPTDMIESRLYRIPELKRHAPVVGYSDHTGGLEAVRLAVALGADIIEAHITHSKLQKGTDHPASIETSDFGRYVELAHLSWRMTRDTCATLC